MSLLASRKTASQEFTRFGNDWELATTENRLQSPFIITRILNKEVSIEEIGDSSSLSFMSVTSGV
jgi:hypothetical protein